MAGLFKQTSKLISVLTGLIFMSGCSFNNAVLVGDQYMQTLKPFGLNNRLFDLQSVFHGIKIIRVIPKDNDSLIDVLTDFEDSYSSLIISPLYANQVDEKLLQNTQVIVLGGEYITENKIIKMPIATEKVYTEIGNLAGEYAKKYSKPALLLLEGNAEVLKKSYEQATENQFPLIVIDITGDEAALPEDFNSLATQSSVLILLAGILNSNAYVSTKDLPIPVITEFAYSSRDWGDRIVASIEYDKSAFKKLLINLINEKIDADSGVIPLKIKKK